MNLWRDEHLSPQLAAWIAQTFGFESIHIRDLGLARARDREVFDAARRADAIILTKDADFVGILERIGPPPRVIWLTCGNTSNANLRRLLGFSLKTAVAALEGGEPVVEIG
jgi:predicted nuclease of predicted toxin-antitoxin system